MDFKNILQALTSLSEGETKETSKGREHKGSYGTSYDGDDDKKEKKPEVKRGRGRPKKDADDSGEVKKYDTKGLHGVFGGGQKPKKEVGKTSKKHSLKEYIEEVADSKSQLDEADQVTIAPAQQNTQVIKQGNKTLGTVTNPQLANQIKQSIGKGEMSLAGDELGEGEMEEKEQGVAEGYDRSVDIGQQMANDGITYSPERENEIIGQMAEYMKRSGFSNKEIRYLMNYSEDYIPDQLSYLPKEKGMEEGFGDVARKVGGALKTGAKAVGKAIVGQDDAELLRDLQRKAGMRGMAHGKPSMGISDVEKVQEKAPPGAKAERMVKHIKKSYSKDGKLSPKEKSIAYATAWKAHNKGKVEESFEYEGMVLTEGAMKDLVINLMTDLETGPRGYNINSAVELKDRAMASRIIDKTLAHGERYKRLAGTLKSQLRDAALEEFGFVDYDQSLEEANTDPDFDMPLMDPVVQQKPSIFAKAKPVVQKSTGMLSSLKRPEQSLNPFESKDMKDIQLEGWEQQLNSLLTEGITVTSSTGQQGAPDSVSINATDADAQELLAIVRQAGLGVFGGQEQPTSSYGAPMDPHSAEPSGYGTEPEVSPDVVGDDSDMLALIKKMTGLSTGPEETSDYEDEEGEETTLQPADDEEGEDEPDEETTEGNAFSGAAAKAKADGIQKGEKINVGGKEYPVKEDDVEEGNKFTGNLAKARAAGKKEADLDGDGDMEKVHEGEHTCEACGMQESKCGCEEQVDENFSNDAGGDAMADTELANLKALLAMGNDLHKMKSSNTVGNPTQVSVRESINEWKKLSGIK